MPTGISERVVNQKNRDLIYYSRLFRVFISDMLCKFPISTATATLPERLNNPFDYTPHPLCEEAYRLLMARLENWRCAADDNDKHRFCEELSQGKMLGVMAVQSKDGGIGWLAAFSGQVCGSFRHEGFVDPVFDYLDENGVFKTKERQISNLNEEISRIERDDFAPVRSEYQKKRIECENRLSKLKDAYRDAKARRNVVRNSGHCTKQELASLVRESQFQKAEMHRFKLAAKAQLQTYENRLKECEEILTRIKRKRAEMSESLQRWLFDSFLMLNGNGERRTLTDIFADTPFGVPPSGAGECCAPKLLQYAYLHKLKPLAIAEYWHGKSPQGEIRNHGAYYPACRGKCLPVLTWMLQGSGAAFEHDDVCLHTCTLNGGEVDIEFENEWFCVVHKPPGLLSVPGKGRDISLVDLLKRRYGDRVDVRLAHRLDQQTSGLVIAAFGETVFKVLQKMFAKRMISKTYVAVLDGELAPEVRRPRGRIDLPLSADILDRPRQRVDFENGKEAVTEYEVVDASEGCTRILLRPLTGRTHQLRVHAASPSGLAIPIVGDNLYRKADATPSSRMLLHAESLTFTFPLDNKLYTFRHPAEF